MSQTLSGLFLVGALNRPRKRKGTNRENPRTIPEQIGNIPEKSGKDNKGPKRTKREGRVQIGKPPRLKHPGYPRLAALDYQIFCQFSPGKIGLKFVTENFTTFFTARKEICHLELTLGAFAPNKLRIFNRLFRMVRFYFESWLALLILEP